MRVIAGRYKGRTIRTVRDLSVRPATDRVRQTVFDLLSTRLDLDGSSILDLFAGSGALGIEALSRGALHAWFVDSSRQAQLAIGANLERCRLAERATIVPRDAWSALPLLAESGPFEVIFADPPYGRDDGPRLLAEVDRLRQLVPGGLLCLETSAADPLPPRSGTLECRDQRRYGTTVIHLYQVSSEEPA